MPIDLNVRVPNGGDVIPFLSMAQKLGFRAIASTRAEAPYSDNTKGGPALINRAEIHESSLSAVKRAVKRFRSRSIIVSLPLKSIETANWAAEDSGIDVLTLTAPLNDCKLRSTTAKLAAASGTALEVPVYPLLHTIGLARARLFKNLRANARIALNAGMPIILSSGCTEPICMRSPMSLSHIGLLLGLDVTEAKKAVFEHPRNIVESNLKHFQSGYLGPGIELVSRKDDK
ncbi:MAG: hypothetical protein EAX95_11100 [Candidatus Thorarchaeota archaeon]|nr:hypothetical protein [Candidatus Thorarchaeota archaeon]